MNFRQRMGLDPRDVLQIDTMDTKTKNRLYNVVGRFIKYILIEDDQYLSNSLSLQIAYLLGEIGRAHV